jgi:hypothetical protein
MPQTKVPTTASLADALAGATGELSIHLREHDLRTDRMAAAFTEIYALVDHLLDNELHHEAQALDRCAYCAEVRPGGVRYARLGVEAPGVETP